MNKPRYLVHEGADLPEIPVAGGLSPPETLAGPDEAMDTRVFITDEDGCSIGHVALWWTDAPPLEGHKPGTIGGFDAKDEATAVRLLQVAASYLRKAGCTLAIGPMNGNTWRRHRFVIESSGRAPFLLEPRNPEPHPAWWRTAGFGELSRYSSSLIPLDGQPAVSPALKSRLGKSGVIIRPLDASRYDDELRAIHAVSLKSFPNNFLYTPLEEESFLGAYRKVKERVDPDLVRIAEKDGEPCGFVFSISDLEAAARGEKPALIVKTLAVDPSARSAGLGSLLVDEVHHLGRAKGFTEAIHALQHESNTSLKITGRHHGQVFRRYALFSKPL
jgi:GNAT superfamily N-acetyltransferase